MLVEENVWDYPRPPRLERVLERIEITFAGDLIARADTSWRVLETSHPPSYYLPFDAVKAEVLRPSAGTRSSLCEWKGQARYWDVRVGNRTARRAAWSYPNPSENYRAIRDHVAFYAQQMDLCRVGDFEVLPQVGDFYGGWITPNLRGPFKGPPGTRFW